MQRKITLTISEELYKDLHFLIGKRKISFFVEQSTKEKIEKLKLNDPLEKGFKMMGQDKDREKEALEWSEAGIDEDIANASKKR